MSELGSIYDRGTTPPRSGNRGGDGPSEPPLFVQGVSLGDLLRTLRRRLPLILAGIAIVLAPAAWYASRSVPIYQATALIRLADMRRAMTQGLESEAGEVPIGRFTDEVLSQIQVLQGQTVLSEVVDRLGLRLASTDPAFPTDLLSNVEVARETAAVQVDLRFLDAAVLVRSGTTERRVGNGTTVNVDGVRFKLPVERPPVDSVSLMVLSREEAVARLMAGFRAAPRQSTDAIEVTFVSADSALALRAVNTVVDVFQRYDATRAQDRSRRRRVFLEEQLGSTDSLMAIAQNELTYFRTDVQLYESKDRIAAQQQTLMDLDVRREEMMATRRMYQSFLTTLQNSGGSERRSALGSLIASPEIAENAVVADAYRQLAEYEAERSRLVTGPLARTAEHPDVERLSLLISQVETRLIDAIQSHLTSVDARITALNGLRARQSVEARRLPGLEADDDRLMQAVASVSRMAEQLRVELQQARMAEAVEGGRVEIVSLASAAFPIGRSSRTVLLLAGVLGLFLGGGLAFGAEAMNTSIRRPQEISSTLRLQRLAVVPKLKGDGSSLRAHHPKKLLASGNGVGKLVHPGRISIAGDAYGILRANLTFAARGVAFRSLAVTSPSPKEGKSTTAANLAISFAQHGSRVVLIDADLRRPSQHEMFSVPKEPGLTCYLEGRCTLTEAVHETPFAGLQLMPAGKSTQHAAELLAGDLTRQGLAALREHFDLVLIDTAPVLLAPETAFLAAEVDAVVLVVRAGQTERTAAEDAVQQLSFAGARVVGGVLNDPDSELRHYRGYASTGYAPA